MQQRAVKSLSLKTKQIPSRLAVKESKLGLSVEVRVLHNQLEGEGEEVNEFLAELICKCGTFT